MLPGTFPWGLKIEIWSFQLQIDGMSRVKAARRTINRLPARRPFAFVTVVRRRIESEPGNHGEGMAFARVDGDPFAGAAVSVTAELGRTHR